jgi:hypothetical protein
MEQVYHTICRWLVFEFALLWMLLSCNLIEYSNCIIFQEFKYESVWWSYNPSINLQYYNFQLDSVGFIAKQFHWYPTWHEFIFKFSTTTVSSPSLFLVGYMCTIKLWKNYSSFILMKPIFFISKYAWIIAWYYCIATLLGVLICKHYNITSSSKWVFHTSSIIGHATW